ncbi:MAG: alpha-2-macroglobulin family protein [Acidimicrobiales bacterium]
MTDADSAPVADAELLVVAVDEAVLALTGYDLLDPLEVFYAPIEGGVNTNRGRSTIRLTDPEALVELSRQLEKDIGATLEKATGGRDDAFVAGEATADFANDAEAPQAATRSAAGGDGSAPVAVRQNFDAPAAWQPDVTTGADGTATVAIDLPDSLTRYRIMVVAVDGADRFGSDRGQPHGLAAVAGAPVGSPVPQLRRRHRRLPIVVQNLTDGDGRRRGDRDGQPRCRRHARTPGDRAGQRSGGGSIPVTTTSAGTAKFRASAMAADHADARWSHCRCTRRPQQRPSPPTAWSTAGSMIQPLTAPEGVVPSSEGWR